MTLPVPLTVRVGDKHVTREVSGVGWRKEAIGGVQSITLKLARPLDRFDANLAAYSRVYVYDARTADAIAEGRLSDTGRSASSGDGQQWEMTAFGPVQHASDTTAPYIVIDKSLERWNMNAYQNNEFSVVVHDENGNPDVHGTKHSPQIALSVPTNFIAEAAYRGLVDAGQYLGSIKADWIAGITNANYTAQLRTGGGIASATAARYSATWTTAGAAASALVTTDFPDTNRCCTLRAARDTSTITAAATHWLRWSDITVRARLKSSDGTDRLTGATYGNRYVEAFDVVHDLLGRFLTQYDGANATIDGTGSYQIDQMAYPDGVTAAQVLDDLMALEPAYRWTTGPSNTAGVYGVSNDADLYAFSWQPWPTTPRYEVTLDDGGSFPSSAQELFNAVAVRWKDAHGRVRSTLVTGACPILDAAGLTRTAIIDLGDETSSPTNAQRVGDNFLVDHKYPANAGTLNVNRPIRDLVLNRDVRPHEIEPGELIRVRGVESYPDALNASSSDGQTVFRIWSMTYTSDGDNAALELDTYARTTTNALARLATRRNRKR